MSVRPILLLAPLAASAFLTLIATSAGVSAQTGQRRGAKLYGQCAACHAGNGSMGPDLVGVVDRRAGALAGYRYSPAMKAANFAWNQARLRAFLHDPQGTVPKNRMPYVGMASDHDVDELIAYLGSRK